MYARFINVASKTYNGICVLCVPYSVPYTIHHTLPREKRGIVQPMSKMYREEGKSKRKRGERKGREMTDPPYATMATPIDLAW